MERLAALPGDAAGAEFGFDLGGGFETDGVKAEGPRAFDEFGDVIGEEAFPGPAAGEADGFGVDFGGGFEGFRFVGEDEVVEVAEERIIARNVREVDGVGVGKKDKGVVVAEGGEEGFGD